MVTAESRGNWQRRWLLPGLPVLGAVALAAWAAHSFATAVHGYVAAYVHPIVMLLAAAFLVAGVGAVIFRCSRRFGIGALLAGVMLVPLYLVMVSLLGVTGSITWQNQPQIRIGPEVRASLVVYLKAGTTNEQINSVWDSVLSDLDPRGRGHMPLPGIGGITRVSPVDGHEAIAVSLSRAATEEEVARVHSRLGQCEYIYRVLENVVPAEVEHLE